MAKKKIELDLLRIVRKKYYEEDRYETIMSILNGDYKYKDEYNYMNNIPHKQMQIYLQKVLVLGTNSKNMIKDKKTLEKVAREFSANIKNVRYRDIKAMSRLSLIYNMLLSLERIREKSKKGNANNLKKTISLFLAGTIFLTAYIIGDYKRKKDGNVPTSPSTSDVANQEIPLNEEIIAFENLYNQEFSEQEEVTEKIEENIEETEVLESDTFEETEVLESQISEETEIDQILEMYGLTEEQFNVLCAIVMTEAKPNSYEDAYAVINTIYNRTISKLWVREINRFYNSDNAGRSLYYQAIMPNQFVVYETGLYKKNLNVRSGSSYQAVIDFLLTKELKHDYLSFKSSDTIKSSDTNFSEHEQFVEGGNKYHNIMSEEDRIIDNEVRNSRN